jgi:hypothetical protein
MRNEQILIPFEQQLLEDLIHPGCWPVHRERGTRRIKTGCFTGTDTVTYQRSLGLEFRTLSADRSKSLLIAEVRCLVICGNTRAEFKNDAMRESFELQRERLQGVTVIGYDELFSKVQKLIELMEKPTG